MTGKTKKRIKSPDDAKNSDANALLLQKRSKLSNTDNDENIFSNSLINLVKKLINILPHCPC